MTEAWGYFVLGLVLLALGGDSIVKGASGLAQRLGASPFVAGLLLVTADGFVMDVNRTAARWFGPRGQELRSLVAYLGVQHEEGGRQVAAYLESLRKTRQALPLAALPAQVKVITPTMPLVVSPPRRVLPAASGWPLRP